MNPQSTSMTSMSHPTSLPSDKTDTSLPLLSVVIPIHNGARWVGETLDSIFQQSFQDFELILVDDASSDDLRAALQLHPDPRLRVIHLHQNLGVAGARNHGVALARGHYIGFCDADDLCLLDRFQHQIDYLEQHPEISVCGSGFTCFDTEDRETVSHPGTPDAIRLALMRGNCFGMSTMMGRAALFRAHPFDQDMSPTEDFDLWARLAAQGVGMANLPQSLLRYRVHAQQASQVKSARLDQLARRIRSRYCAQLLGNASLLRSIQHGELTLADLDVAQQAIASYCLAHPDFSPEAFRFLLAWMYQQLPDHGWSSWWHWHGVQQGLGLSLDRNYRLNLFVLAFLPRGLRSKYFETLIKLKR